MSETEPVRTVKCPTCRKPVPWLPDQRFRPFCSERCRLIDLGEWIMEEKKIPGEPVEVLDKETQPDWQ